MIIMANRGRFHIPSAEEMEKESGNTSGPKPSSLFSAHRKTLQDNIAREKNKSPSKAASTYPPPSNPKSINLQQTTAATSTTFNSVTGSTEQNSNAAATSGRPLPKFSLPTVQQKTGRKDQDVPDTIDKRPETSPEKGSPTKAINSQSLIVSARQRGNPILKSVRNVPWEFGDIVADYQMGPSTCALFLSLRYHNLNPNYIHERLRQLGHSYSLRVLLVQVDIKDPTHCLKELAKMCILADCTLILAFSPEEAGKYLETYKAFENKPPDLIMEKTEGTYLSRVTETMTAVKSVNKTDTSTLLSTFGTVKKIVEASEEDLSFCPGFGPQKAKRLHNVFHEPFIKDKRRKPEESPQKDKNTNQSTKTT